MFGKGKSNIWSVIKQTPWIIYLISLALAIIFIVLSLRCGSASELSTLNNIGCGLFASVFVAFFVDYIHVRERVFV